MSSLKCGVKWHRLGPPFSYLSDHYVYVDELLVFLASFLSLHTMLVPFIFIDEMNLSSHVIPDDVHAQNYLQHQTCNWCNNSLHYMAGSAPSSCQLSLIMGTSNKWSCCDQLCDIVQTKYVYSRRPPVNRPFVIKVVSSYTPIFCGSEKKNCVLPSSSHRYNNLTMNRWYKNRYVTYSSFSLLVFLAIQRQ